MKGSQTSEIRKLNIFQTNCAGGIEWDRLNGTLTYVLWIYLYRSAHSLLQRLRHPQRTVLGLQTFGAQKYSYLLHGSHLELKNVAQACSVATVALESVAWACSVATVAL